MNIYRFLDYREAIEKTVIERKKEDSKINFANLSEALRVQKTYVSRVLKKNAHFSSDQLHLACQYLAFDSEETHYLSLLFEHARTGLAGRRKSLLEEIRRFQSDRSKIQKHLTAKMVEVETSEKYLEYYLDPRIAIVHTYFNIADCRRHPEKIRLALSISEKQFAGIILVLEKLKFICWNPLQKAYDLLVNHIHLTKESPLSFPAEQLTRTMVLDHLKKLPGGQRFYYSVSFAADEKTRNFVHEEFLKFLRKTESEIKAAPSENVFYMAFDLFPWKVDV